MIDIKISSDVPDTTYFRRGDCEPDITDGGLIIYDGRGTYRRSWGAPGVTSNVIYTRDDFVAVHVGFRHKHGGGQFWRYYYKDEGGRLSRISWRKLDDDLRADVIEAHDKRAPIWIKSPGKTRAEYKKQDPMANAFTAYKIMAINTDGEYTSLYDPSVVYTLGKTMVERSRPHHGGGWYVYLDKDSLVDRYLAGGVIGSPQPGRHVLVMCKCWGNREHYDIYGAYIPKGWRREQEEWGHKIAVTYCKPIRVIEEFEVEAPAREKPEQPV